MNNLITQSDYWYEFETNGKKFRLHHTAPDKLDLTDGDNKSLPPIKIGKDINNPAATTRKIKELDCLLLKFFLENSNRFHTSNEIYNQVWKVPKRRIANTETNVEGIVSGRIYYLRKFLGDTNQQSLIEQGQKNSQTAYRFNEKPEQKSRNLHGFTQPELQSKLGVVDCPYRGLSTFDEKHAHLFKGRRAATDELLEAVEQNSFTVYASASGVGKTSLIFAGLTPALKEKNWIVVSMRPHTEPFHSLAKAMVSFLHPELSGNRLENKANQIAKEFRNAPTHVWNKIAQIKQKAGSQTKLLLVIDQFEDIYASLKQDSIRQDFFNGLFNVIEHLRNGETQCRILVSMRVDILERLSKDQNHFAEAITQKTPLFLSQMTQDELLEAVKLPAEEVGLQIEDGLPERMIDDLGSGSRLPLLSFALKKLWEKRKGATLTHEAYGQIANVRKALAEHAENFYSKLDNDNRKLLRKVMLNLVEVGDSQLEPSRRLLKRDKFTEQEWDLVTELAHNERLLTIARDETGHKETVELTHESLMTAWETYAEWIKNDRDYLIWRSEFEKAFKKYKKKEAKKKDNPKVSSDDELLRGDELKEAFARLNEIKNSSLPYSITGEEKTFILESRRHQRDSRREKFFLVSAVVLLAAVSTFGIWYWLSPKKSDNEFLARKLLSDAGEIKKEQPDLIQLGMLLAIESYKRVPTIEAYQYIHENLSILPKMKFSVEHADGVFSPDGKTLITAGDDQRVTYWDVATNQGIKSYVHNSYISKIAVSNDGKYQALVGKNNIVVIADAETSEPIHSLKQPDEVNDLKFSPSGKFLAVTCIGKDIYTVHLWNVAEGKLERDFKASPNRTIHNISFSPDSKYLASAIFGLNNDADSGAYIWEISSGKERFLSHQKGVMDAKFSPDSKFLATGGKEQFVRLWNVENGEESARFKQNEPVNVLEFSPDGRFLATGNELYLVGQGFTSRVFDVSTGKEISKFTHESDTHSLAFSPDGKFIVSGSYRHNEKREKETARVWETETGQEISRIVADNSVKVSFTPNGKFLLTKTVRDLQVLVKYDDDSFGIERRNQIDIPNNTDFYVELEDGSLAKAQTSPPDFSSLIQIWDPFSRALETVRVSEAVSDSNPSANKMREVISPSNFAVSKNGKFLVAAHNETIRVWNIPEAKEIAKFPNIETTFEIEVSEDGKYVVASNGHLAGERKTKTYIWKTEIQKLIFEQENKNFFAPGITISHDNKYLAELGEGYVKISELETGKSTLNIGRSGIAPTSVSFSPDSKQIAVGSSIDAQIWNIESKSVIHSFDVKNSVPDLAFSKDGRFLALTEKSSGVVSIYDASSFRKVSELKHDSKQFYNFDFNSNSKYIVTSDESNFFHIWEIETGREIAKIRKENGTASFAEDDSIVIIENGNVSLQKWFPEDVINEACSRLSGNLTKEGWDKFLPSEEPRKTCENLQ